jgi:hypothetical protein
MPKIEVGIKAKLEKGLYGVMLALQGNRGQRCSGSDKKAGRGWEVQGGWTCRVKVSHPKALH